MWHPNKFFTARVGFLTPQRRHRPAGRIGCPDQEVVTSGPSRGQDKADVHDRAADDPDTPRRLERGELVTVKVAVIGAGPGGIAMGTQLAAAGHDFTIFDRADGFGGTWRNNTYPGAACDVPSHFYSFSFALNPRWSKTFAQQSEILAYLERVASDYGLANHFVGQTRVTELRWDDGVQRWSVSTADGKTSHFDAVVSAVGMLDVPNIPAIPGANRFRGRTFHSSNWDHTRSTAG
jgi:cyclohexanone monooxygenase